jgi:hypothetical protein
MLNRPRNYQKRFEEFLKENREKLLNDKRALEMIERRIEKRHEIFIKDLSR